MGNSSPPPAPAAPQTASSTKALHGTERGVCADRYDSHEGRYSPSLATQMVRLAAITSRHQALDVGCGPGALAIALAGALGAENVAAIDPHEPFVKSCSERIPNADARVGAAERLPFADQHFDVVLAQLVLNFVADPERAVAEMRRVLRHGGVIAACVWDYPGEMTMLRVFWDAATALDPRAATALDESRGMRYCHRSEVGQLWRTAGIEHVEAGELLASAHYPNFDTLWGPFEAGEAPAGPYCKTLDTQAQAALRHEYWQRLGSPTGPFYLSARAWCVRGRN
jgi:ubiquinone/menaquinone biosynthesis C-methylase UbiE